ncbi:MAG: 3-hydroxyacyl-CoA dehydrogenase family protein [Longimicrobiales bacterium]
MTNGSERIAVVGAGTMGHGIAQVAAAAGYDVALIDSAADRADAGLARIRENLDGGVRRGKVTTEARDAALARVHATTDLAAAVGDAALVVEAVPERMELKAAVFRQLDTHAPADCVFATNTSSLSITDLQRKTARPARVLGLHFFNPVHINRLVEVVRGRDTAEPVVERALAFVRRLDKEPVVINDSPGFATSRLGVLLGLEAMRMVEEGVASAEDIDRAMELGYRHPMGPLKLTDLVGLDVRLDIARYLHEQLGAEHFRPPRLLSDMVAAGKLGQKSGEGFYRWDEP